jgi:hypothetical protein
MDKIQNYFLLVILLFTLNNINIAGTHSISTTIELTATSINRYLNTQYNQAGFPRSFVTGNYTVALILPEILLTPNNAALHMVFDVYSGEVKLYRFEIKPSISIPAGSINGSQILAFCTDLTDKLNTVSPVLPEATKQGIIEKYNILGFLMYPSKLIDQVNTTWFESQSIYLADPYFSLAWQVTRVASYSPVKKEKNNLSILTI